MSKFRCWLGFHTMTPIKSKLAFDEDKNLIWLVEQNCAHCIWRDRFWHKGEGLHG
jgi:hypothetical protein